MNELIKFQTIKGSDGNPAFVVVPYTDFVEQYGRERNLIPHEVVGIAVEQEVSPIRAWREYLGLTQAEVAKRLDISQAAFAQLEVSSRQRKSTLRRVADAYGITFGQLDF